MEVFDEEVKKEEKKKVRKIDSLKQNKALWIVLGVIGIGFLFLFLSRNTEIVVHSDVEAQKRVLEDVLKTQQKLNEELIKEIRSLKEELKKARQENIKQQKKKREELKPKEELGTLLKEKPKRKRYEFIVEPPPSQAVPIKPSLNESENPELNLKKRNEEIKTVSQARHKKTVYIPLGSVVKGKILHSFPAPVGGKKFPAVLIELDGDAKLPNGYRFPLKGCVVIAVAEGTWVGERAKLQAKKLSCMLPNGKVIEKDVNGFIVSAKDGIEGVKGKFLQVNRKQILTYLGGTAVSGFFSALQNAQVDKFSGYFGTTTNIKDEFLYALYGSLAQTWNEFARWYLEQAKEIVPIVFVKAGEPVFITFLDGVNLGVSVDEYKKLVSE